MPIKHWISALFLLLLFCGQSFADGKFYARGTPPPGVPYQRALVVFDGEREVLLVQSQRPDATPGNDGALVDEATLQAVMEAFAGYTAFTMETIVKRRAEPTDDLFSILVNAEVDGELLEKVAAPDAAGRALLTQAAERMRLTARGYHRVLRVARTLADLEGGEGVRRIHFAEALSYRRLMPGRNG